MKLDPKPDGKGLWILTQLEPGPLGRKTLIAVAAKDFTPFWAERKLPYYLAALQRAQLIEYADVGHLYELRASGRDALKTLRSGKAVVIDDRLIVERGQSVRIFSGTTP